ncbi:MAG: 50S ribosomal protein L29 [Candidatus Tagabacteria bacterium RIFCSPLOWO2_01_FULL_39_11]|uniref:Large ribosomal subunit protein uL29 n=1 Tax=Candidatus Tagabacteria bacterium RIFCSPLOWO2_01_FULL_39_11 TaxID=1802295 RepID=A0A1G2LRU1_9BACT|nr:MAG: 50S ribosomal protein L29 [Candidatus Tagabacteria bacterium RIFCSPLOWO2_01_FULL_39_11]
MKIVELKQLSKKELKETLQKKRTSLRSFYFNISKGKVKNMKEAREIKKDIARILTLENQGTKRS